MSTNPNSKDILQTSEIENIDPNAIIIPAPVRAAFQFIIDRYEQLLAGLDQRYQQLSNQHHQLIQIRNNENALLTEEIVRLVIDQIIDRIEYES